MLHTLRYVVWVGLTGTAFIDVQNYQLCSGYFFLLQQTQEGNTIHLYVATITLCEAAVELSPSLSPVALDRVPSKSSQPDPTSVMVALVAILPWKRGNFWKPIRPLLSLHLTHIPFFTFPRLCTNNDLSYKPNTQSTTPSHNDQVYRITRCLLRLKIRRR